MHPLCLLRLILYNPNTNIFCLYNYIKHIDIIFLPNTANNRTDISSCQACLLQAGEYQHCTQHHCTQRAFAGDNDNPAAKARIVALNNDY